LRHGAEEVDPRRAIRFVDLASGRNDLLGRVASLDAMAHVVARRLEGARAGSRFPLLRLIGRREALTAQECEALVREVTRLRAALAPLTFFAAAGPAAPAAGASRRELDDEIAARFRPLLRTAPAHAPSPPTGDATGTLADAFAWPLSVLEHIARLGATTRRGARFEVADEPVEPPVDAAARGGSPR